MADGLAPGDAAAAEVLAWARERGVHCPDVELHTFPETGCRGVRATRALSRGDVLVAVPAALLLTTATARADAEYGAFLADALARGALTPEAALCCHLLGERARGAQSPWAVFVRSLPAAFASPLSATPAQVQELGHPALVAAAQRIRRRAQAQWASAAVQGFGAAFLQPRGVELSWPLWHWAVDVVESRSCFVNHTAAAAGAAQPQQRDSCALVPVGDMLNHSSEVRGLGGLFRDLPLGDTRRCRTRRHTAAQSGVGRRTPRCVRSTRIRNATCFARAAT